jgi:UDP-4-amino-4,6-dideoxy-N-acetyl-beta-L-altrosamine N-acetyltransferase
MIAGKKVILDSVNTSDLEQMRQWRNEPELRSYFREHRIISDEMQEIWYTNTVNDAAQVNFAIRVDGTLIGHCGLFYIKWIARHAEFGIYIGNRQYRENGYGSDALRTLIKYGFEQLNLNKIWCEVYNNNAALDIYKHLGFTPEGVLRQNAYKDGQFLDSHILSMLKDEYNSGV